MQQCCLSATTIASRRHDVFDKPHAELGESGQCHRPLFVCGQAPLVRYKLAVVLADFSITLNLKHTRDEVIIDYNRAGGVKNVLGITSGYYGGANLQTCCVCGFDCEINKRTQM